MDLWFIILVESQMRFYQRYLVSHEAGQMDLLAGIVLGEGLGLAAVALGPLLGEESLGPMTGSFEFPVRHRATNHV